MVLVYGGAPFRLAAAEPKPSIIYISLGRTAGFQPPAAKKKLKLHVRGGRENPHPHPSPPPRPHSLIVSIKRGVPSKVRLGPAFSRLGLVWLLS